MDKQLLAKFRDLNNRKRTLDGELEAVKKELGALKTEIMSMFEMDGVNSVRLDDGQTNVYIHRQLWASPVDGDYGRACKMLKENSLGDFVQERFNINSFSAFVREMDREGKPLPDAFKGVINVAEQFDIRIRG
jgi:hypothetical protein